MPDRYPPDPMPDPVPEMDDRLDAYERSSRAATGKRQRTRKETCEAQERNRDSSMPDPVPGEGERMERQIASEKVLALCKAAAKVRGGAWVQGAPTHIFADVLLALECDGWHLTHRESDGSND